MSFLLFDWCGDMFSGSVEGNISLKTNLPRLPRCSPGPIGPDWGSISLPHLAVAFATETSRCGLFDLKIRSNHLGVNHRWFWLVGFWTVEGFPSKDGNSYSERGKNKTSKFNNKNSSSKSNYPPKPTLNQWLISSKRCWLDFGPARIFGNLWQVAERCTLRCVQLVDFGRMGCVLNIVLYISIFPSLYIFNIIYIYYMICIYIYKHDVYICIFIYITFIYVCMFFSWKQAMYSKCVETSSMRSGSD